LLLKKTIFGVKSYSLSMKKLFLLLLIILSNNTFACSCAEKPSVKEDWTYSHDVYTAKIISVDSLHFTSSGNRIYLFNAQVIHHYKNEPYPGYEMRTFYFTEGGSCDFGFQINKDYLIYESRLQNPILSYASICSRTALLSDIKPDELKELELLKSQSKSIKNDRFELISWVSEKELSAFKEQARETEKLSVYNLYLIISTFLFLITAIIFITLYMKIKRKLKQSKT
jgi:hypothetical protein